MRVGVVVTTYRRPDALELVLEGYAHQDRPPHEILVADDGSDDATAAVVDRMAAETGLPLVHVWHADRGFRKTEILNRAIRATHSDYLIFTDGDCVPRPDFVSTHVRLARPGRFLSGGYVRLSPATTRDLTRDDVSQGRAFDARWLGSHGTKAGRHGLRLLQGRVLPRILDALTTTRPTFNGMSSSVWTSDLERLNGFDLDFVYGGLDRELGGRLENAGVRGVQVRHRAVVLHLHHERPYKDVETIRRQRALRASARKARTVRTPRGLAELDDSVPQRVRRLSAAALPPGNASAEQGDPHG